MGKSLAPATVTVVAEVAGSLAGAAVAETVALAGRTATTCTIGVNGTVSDGADAEPSQMQSISRPDAGKMKPSPKEKGPANGMVVAYRTAISSPGSSCGIAEHAAPPAGRYLT